MAKQRSSRGSKNNGGGFDRRILYVFAALAFLILLIVLARRQSPVLNTGKSNELGIAPEILGGFPRVGKGGDPDLNLQKNRITAPTKPEEYDPSGIVNLGHQLLDREGRQHRANWDADAKAYLDRMESIGARLTGYLVHAKESGPESCNGYVDSLRDYHIWIGGTPDAEKLNSVVVEVTPRWKTVHPEWRLRYFEKLSESHAKVRVTGWLMWDEEHPDEVGKSRGSQWEVHPITNFEVFANGEWRTLNTDEQNP